MSKHAYKNNKQQDSKNRINAMTSVGYDPGHTQDGFIPEQDIQKRAFEIYQQKGGSHIDNWLEAERILREEQRSASK